MRTFKIVPEIFEKKNKKCTKKDATNLQNAFFGKALVYIVYKFYSELIGYILHSLPRKLSNGVADLRKSDVI